MVSTRLTGNDLRIAPGEDFVSLNGRLQITNGAESIQEGLRRRLQTNLRGYARWVRTPNGLRLLNPEYGNGAYDYLSEPLSRENALAIQAAVNLSAEGETRIKVLESSIQTTPTSGRVDLQLNYRILDNTELANLKLSLDAS